MGDNNGQPDRVHFSFGQTINLGNYESAKFDAGMSSDVGPDETVEQAQERVQEQVKRAILSARHGVETLRRSR